ncbi:MAG: hypothetical protein RIA08_19135 [Roseovarius sp.]|uniref:hypothetical protein n=1 Tax=Roseovarius sp. TaxID=1486281 RepID=UPI0032EE3AAB
MESQTFGSIVAMEFSRKPSIGFADIVEEFDIAFQMVDSRTRSLTWDCNDIAIIDRDNVRVALGWLPARQEGQSWHLVIAVGSPGASDEIGIDPNSFRYLADRIVERTQEFLPSTAVLHGDARQPISADLVDKTFDLLRMNTRDMHGDSQFPRDDRFAPAAEPDLDAGAEGTMPPPWMDSDAAFRAGTAKGRTSDRTAMGRTRTFTNDLGQMLLTRAEPTKPLRLTIHTLALSLCLYVPPLGAAMFAYTMLRDVFPMAAQAV